MDCFRTCFTHVQTCDNVRVQSAAQWTASVHTLHMSKHVITFVFKVLMDCFPTYFTHVQTCDNVRVQNAAEWIASVHTSHAMDWVSQKSCYVDADVRTSCNLIRLPLKKPAKQREND